MLYLPCKTCGKEFGYILTRAGVIHAYPQESRNHSESCKGEPSSDEILETIRVLSTGVNLPC